MKFQTRKDKAYTRFGIFTNIFDKEDKMICGGWYFHIHINHRQFAVWGQLLKEIRWKQNKRNTPQWDIHGWLLELMKMEK